jgi:hypothetical protein
MSKRFWTHEPLPDAEPIRTGMISELKRFNPNLTVIDNALKRLGADTTQKIIPRVLNANFADPAADRVLTADEGLIADQEYDLLVDIGPRWSTLSTIVHGHSEFPEQLLRPDPSGAMIDVLLLSDHQPRKAGP